MFLVCITRHTLRYWYLLCGLCSVLVFIILVALRFINSFCYSLSFFLVFLMCAVSQCRLRFVYSVLLCALSITFLVFIVWTGAFVMCSAFQVFIVRTTCIQIVDQ